MDIDRYIQRNEPTWRRLSELSRRGARDARRLSDDEVAELISLYQRVSAQLSHARAQYRDPDLNARLSGVLGEARVVIYRGRRSALRSVATFFTETFPAAVWGSRRYLLAAAALFLLPALGMGIWLANSPAAMDASVPPELQQLIAEREFAEYYRSDAAQNFAGYVTINNIQVAFLAFALGVVPILGTGWVLAYNGLNIGVMAAVMHRADEAGAAGLRLSWALVAPGDRTRSEEFRDEGMRAVVIVMGLALWFVVAGIIEGFVTPSGLPTSLRVAVGVAALAVVVAYVVLLGSRAERKGLTGLLGEATRDELSEADAEAGRGTLLTIR